MDVTKAKVRRLARARIALDEAEAALEGCDPEYHGHSLLDEELFEAIAEAVGAEVETAEVGPYEKRRFEAFGLEFLTMELP